MLLFQLQDKYGVNQRPNGSKRSITEVVSPRIQSLREQEAPNT